MFFDFYTDPLLKELRYSGVEFRISNIMDNYFSYASDLVNTCENCSKSYNIDLIHQKVKFYPFPNQKIIQKL